MAIERLANTDFQNLHELKYAATKDPDQALPQVAKQFEAIFLRTMLKTMRMGSHFIEEDSAFRGKNAETFQEMLDGQYVDKISNSSTGIGIAEMLTKQLSGKVGKAENSLEIGQSANKYTISNRDTTISEVDKPIEVKGKSNKTVNSKMVDDFVSSIWDKAKQAAAAMGIDPKVLIAQAALETGWGQSLAKDADGSSSHNLFNIKSSDKNNKFDSVTVKTTEYIASTPIKMNASFRKYSSVEDSFDDYVSLIKNNERYQQALASSSNPERYVSELGKAGYATDPHYGSKIMSIYHGDELNDAIKRCGLVN